MSAAASDFGKRRWGALHAVLASASVSGGAKVVYTALITRFAGRETGRARVRHVDVAGATAMRPDTVYRHICALVDQGHLIALEPGRGGGLYGFRLPPQPGLRVVAASENAGRASELHGRDSDERPTETGRASEWHDQNPEEHPGNSEVHPSPPAPPFKETQIFPNERASDPRRYPVEHIAEVKPGSHREAEWNAWLTARGWPTVAELGVRLNDGWGMPFTMPPGNQHGIEERITARFLDWASSRMVERREASA